MYYKYFGFNKNPFEIHPDPDFLYLSEKHREALSHLKYAVLERKPFLLLIGDIGVGKTTLLNFFIKDLQRKNDIILIPIFNPNLTVRDFYILLAGKLGLYNVKSKVQLLEKFRDRICSLINQNKIVVLVIDEAQTLSDKLLREMQLVANLVQDVPGFVIILVGQPDLYKRLMESKLSSLRQRFSFKFFLKSFDDVADVDQYVKTRILKAGSFRTDLFTKDAIESIYKISGGVPRLINIICDHALLNAYLQEKRSIDRKIILEAVKDLDHLVSESQLRGLRTQKFKKLIFFLLVPIILLILLIVFGADFNFSKFF